MIKIYGSKASSAGRCVWLMEELGLEYQIVPLDFQKNEHKSPEYMELNPNGKVPTLVDGTFTLWESIAINTYLAEKHQPALMGSTPEERALVNQWSLWSAIHLHESMEVLVLKTWRKEEESDKTKQAREALPRWLTILNNHLSTTDYMVSNRFTLADVTVMSVVNSSKFVGYELSAYPAVMAWMERLSARPAFQKYMAK